LDGRILLNGGEGFLSAIKALKFMHLWITFYMSESVGNKFKMSKKNEN
jgi:hypothetical protein